jgi:hypothetical protein
MQLRNKYFKEIDLRRVNDSVASLGSAHEALSVHSVKNLFTVNKAAFNARHFHVNYQAFHAVTPRNKNGAHESS